MHWGDNLVLLVVHSVLARRQQLLALYEQLYEYDPNAQPLARIQHKTCHEELGPDATYTHELHSVARRCVKCLDVMWSDAYVRRNMKGQALR